MIHLISDTWNFLQLLFISLLFVGITSCQSESNIDNKPANFIEKEQFVELLYEVSLLEGNLGNFNLNQGVLRDSAMSLYQGVFEKYEITFDDFKKNQEYYILTDQYKELSQKVLDRVILEEEKYKDVEPLKIISFVQLKQLFELDGLSNYFETDTVSTYQERLDSALRHYRKHPENLAQVSVDSLSFEVNIARLRRGADLFQLNTVFKKMPTNE